MRDRTGKDAILTAAHRIIEVVSSDPDPHSVDQALATIPSYYSLASLTSERNGYGWHAILDSDTVDGGPVYGKGHTIAEAIRSASSHIVR